MGRCLPGFAGLLVSLWICAAPVGAEDEEYELFHGCRLSSTAGIVRPDWVDRQVVADLSEDERRTLLSIRQIEGTLVFLLTYYGDYISDPVWSPRGDYIAYCSREASQFHIYIVDITGQNAYKLTEIGSNEAPSWSPDGLHLVYSSNVDGAYSLWIMNFDGSGKRKLNLKGACKSPDWSVNLK